MSAIKNIAIIGAGLGGLCTALTLNLQSIPCTIYEFREAPLDIGGTVTLSPNASVVLDTLGVWELVKDKGHSWDTMYFRNQDDKAVDQIQFGSVPKYGYRALRIYRHVLIKALLAKIAEKGISVQWNKKFVRVVSESDNEVKFQFTDDTTEVATTLIGTDGIFSRVRKYIYPDIEPVFVNVAAVTAPAKRTVVHLPEGSPIPVTIMSKDHGAFVLMFQQPDESEVLVARQAYLPNLGRDGWDHLHRNKEWCYKFLNEGTEDFPAYVGEVTRNVDLERISIWPFATIPELESWTSKAGLVTILADAAHAIPPSTGQGVNQALEDAYTLSLILSRCTVDQLKTVLPKWKAGRQQRIDKLIQFANWMNARRASKAENEAGRFIVNPGEAGGFDASETIRLDWVFKPDFDQMVKSWLES